MRLGFEYRKTIGERYWFKAGALVGSNNSFSNFRGDIISVTDSAITREYFTQEQTSYGLTFGMERLTSSPFFSFEAGLNIMYSSRTDLYYWRTDRLLDNGNWQLWEFVESQNSLEENPSSTIKRHFIVPSDYFGMNANLPFGDDFIISLNGRFIAGVPIYMGASDIDDPLDKFIGNPPSITNFETSFGFRLRYMF